MLLFRPTVVEKLMLESMCQISRLVSIDQIPEAEERDESEEGGDDEIEMMDFNNETLGIVIILQTNDFYETLLN